MILTSNQKMALDELKNVTSDKGTLTPQGSSTIISMLCDLHTDNTTLKDKLHRRNMQIKDLNKKGFRSVDQKKPIIENTLTKPLPFTKGQEYKLNFKVNVNPDQVYSKFELGQLASDLELFVRAYKSNKNYFV